MIDLRAGDCRTVLASLPDASVDAVVTDPPYELGFMGKAWDGTGIAYDVAMWAEVLRVLKPGGHLLSFGGTRTWHRMACAVEDAGFEMRDTIAWLYGSGVPKSLNVGKAVDALAPPSTDLSEDEQRFCTWVRDHSGLSASDVRRLAGSDRFHSGRVEIVNTATADAPRMGRRAMVPTAATWEKMRQSITVDVPGWVDALVKSPPAPPPVNINWKPGRGQGVAGDSEWSGWGTALKPAHEPIVVARKPFRGTVAANVVEHGTGALNIDACRIGTSGATKAVDTVARWGEVGGTGERRNQIEAVNAGRWPANVVLDEAMADVLDQQSGVLHSQDPRTRQSAKASGGKMFDLPGNSPSYADKGGASRFFKRAEWSEGDSVVAWRQDLATTADNPSSQPRPPGDSAPSDAATSANLAGKPSSSSPTERPTMAATPSASRPTAETGTPAMPTTGSASWQGQPPDEPSPPPSHARSAETPTRTGTTTTTPSHSPSGGSAASTTSADTSSSTAPGVKVLDGADRFIYCAKAPTKERPRHDGTAHPTVKPLTLMRWLVRLVTPPGGTVLDPFAGSGTTLEAALIEGFHAIGIEANPDYLPLIRQRLARHDDTLFGSTA